MSKKTVGLLLIVAALVAAAVAFRHSGSTTAPASTEGQASQTTQTETHY